jgi:hypothetical protein
VAHADNPSYLGGWDPEYYGLRPGRENSSRDFISPEKRWVWWHVPVIPVEV